MQEDGAERSCVCCYTLRVRETKCDWPRPSNVDMMVLSYYRRESCGSQGMTILQIQDESGTFKLGRKNNVKVFGERRAATFCGACKLV